MASHATKQPEPVLSKAKITATISGLVSLLVTLGVLPAALGSQINGTVEAVVTAVMLVIATVPHIVSAVQTRKDVTPVAAPKDDEGNELVPAGSAAATLQAANVIAEMNAEYPADGPEGDADAN